MHRARAAPRVLAALVLPLLLVAPAASGSNRPPRRPAATLDTAQGNVNADSLSQVRRAVQLEDYGVAESGAAGGEFQANNPGHRFESRFDSRGVRVRAASNNNAWEWSLTLTRWGRPGALAAAPPGRCSAREDRIELDRESLSEWFVNTPEGLEHGFTVPAPPEGPAGLLIFELALAGDLRPVFAEDGQAVDFYGHGSVSVLRYAKLMVTDTAGEVLAARMVPIAGGIRIDVEDAGAIYPIEVDPLITSPSWSATGEFANDNFGYAVATAGDVNGDGYSDVIVGATRPIGGTGKAYLYLGGPGGLSAGASWTAVGEAAYDQFAYSVATAGDVNGDGYSDVIVGAPFNTNGTGKAYLYMGGPSGLSAIAAWSAVGEAGNDTFGYALATAGDVNGDGYSDVIVGAFGDSSYKGKAYLYLGGAGGLSTIAAWSAVGEAVSDDFGHSVGTAGDVDGDGYSDVIVGAYGHNSTGKAYLFLGGSGGLSASAAWTATAEPGITHFGFDVATAGDVNGDGRSDVLVSADEIVSWKGRAYLYLGAPGGLSAIASWNAVGEADEDFRGLPVATAGDVNGDGYSDVMVGHDGYAAVGKAFLYLGGSGGLGGSASWTATSPRGFARFGFSLGTAGDVNGDGYSDLIVGDYGGLSGQMGVAYVYQGGPASLSLGVSWSVVGVTASDVLGTSVATAGDVNGDGYADGIVGAYGSASGTGKAYLHLGGPGGLTTSASWTAAGQAASDYFGYSVATAGDVNGDGYADVIVGAYGYTSNTGKAYLYMGGPGGLSASGSWSATGQAVNDYFGWSVASAGDVNGDGYSDVIVGAYGDTSSTGKAYLYLGGPAGLSATESWSAAGQAMNAYFGYSVATAGDINGDGYSDVIVGAFGDSFYTGKAYLYLGGPGGLSAGASWTAAGEAVSNDFGHSVGTAGDVNGDGYADVVVGAHNNASSRGKVYLYLGDAGGLSTSAAWTAVGAITNDSFGYSVGTAGDVNADGYSDVLVGAIGDEFYTGKAYLYLGAASGLSTSAGWSALGEIGGDEFGFSVATTGDVNGDGFSDVLVGAVGYASFTGKAYSYFGGGGAGVPLRPRQFRADLSAPIHPGGSAYQQQFRLGLTLRSPVGRVTRQLQWQVAPWGGTFLTRFNPVQTDSDWYANAASLARLLALPHDQQRYLWRARVKYDRGQSPFVPHSPWFTLSGNGLLEADLFSTSEAAPGPCEAPDEEPYIANVTLDGNGKVVLHYQDANQPSAVTGYNIYRASSPTGPWTVIGSNVVDMNAGTPDNQYVDQTSDSGGLWYYKITAYNGACGAEGPF